MFRRIALYFAASLAIIAHGALTWGAPLVFGQEMTAPRAVALSDASRAPDWVAFLPGRAESDFVPGCATESSAYRWDGGALGAQRWNTMHDRSYWPHPRGGRVVFDGVRFVNRTDRLVIVAAWCS